MSHYLVRRLSSSDWQWINQMPEAARLDRRGVESPGRYTFVALEAGRPVGIASGSADTGGGNTAFLHYVRSLTGQWGPFLVLLAAHAENGIKTGHTYAEATIPTDDLRQCTNVGPTAAVTAGLTEKAGLQWEDVGLHMPSRQPALRRTRVELAPLVERLAKLLQGMGITWEWA